VGARPVQVPLEFADQSSLVVGRTQCHVGHHINNVLY